jgi:hypothetical protein
VNKDKYVIQYICYGPHRRPAAKLIWIHQHILVNKVQNNCNLLGIAYGLT